MRSSLSSTLRVLVHGWPTRKVVAKKCCCVFQDGVCIESCKYHGDGLREKDEEIAMMKKIIKAQARLLVSYRVEGRPPEWVFDTLEKAKNAGYEV